jgi:dTDP-D-glucose 4,6-dehydratase
MVAITGGTGFIGSNLVHYWIEKMTEAVINVVDKLTDAGNLQSLARIYGNPRHIFVRADTGDRQLISNLLAKYQPLKAIDLAAESHVDRSIQNPDTFVETNVRYPIDTSKIAKELGWSPKENFDSGLRKTIRWYLGNQEWFTNVASGAYRDRGALHYDEHADSA